MRRRYRPRPAVLAVIGMAAVMALLAVLGPYLAPYDPFAVDMTARLQSESLAHWCGTDQLGRDVFSRILHGARLTLTLAGVIVAASAAIGIAIGAVAGLARGRADRVLSAVLDVVLAFPSMIVALGLIGFLGPSLTNVALALILTQWAQYARVMRALVLSESARNYVRWAPFSGASRLRTAWRLILPNTVPQLLVMICQDMGAIILTVAGFSVIGIGVPPPHPEWGALLLGSRAYLMTAPWLLIYPGLAIFLAVVSWNLMGDVLRDALDPRDHTGEYSA